ncbi:MAG: radical SAM protein [bacterium]
MKRVFLLSTPFEENFKIKSIRDYENSYGLGLAYLHSVIERAGYCIKTQNYNTADESISVDDIKSNLINFRPDYLLMQMFTMNRVSSYRIFKLAKEVNKDIKIIIGGVHATIMFEQLLKNFEIDYVVLGEGEETILELLSALDTRKDVSNVKGIAYSLNGNIVKNSDRKLIENLDKIPFPKHELFITPKRIMACILTSRGCPFKCSFCCLHTISKRIYRERSVANIVSEVEYIVNNFKNIKLIQVADDTFNLNQQRVIDLCKEIIKRKIKIKFSCSARIKPASVEMFELMEKAGFISIGFGLETGSKKLLKSIHKNITQEDAKETFGMLKNIKDINIVAYLIVGFPGESIDTVNETISFLKELYNIRRFKNHGVAILWVYPKTEVYDLMKAKKAINDDYWLTDNDVPRYTAESSYNELWQFYAKIRMATFSMRGKPYFVLKGMQYFLRAPISNTQKLFKLLQRKY